MSNSEPLLTSDIPIGLGFGSYSGVIQVDGNGNQITSESPFQPIEFEQKPEGLSVTSGKTLALIGNGVNLNDAAETLSLSGRRNNISSNIRSETLNTEKEAS